MRCDVSKKAIAVWITATKRNFSTLELDQSVFGNREKFYPASYGVLDAMSSNLPYSSLPQ
jgi:hypothetical protein